MSQTIQEKIKQRRSQMLVHSFLYYHMDTNIVSDDQWQQWAEELTDLQKSYPDPIGFYDKEFEDWNGTTGMHLPVDGWVREKAMWVLSYNRK